MAPELSYDNMEIGNGSDAVAQFAMLTRGKYDEHKVKKVRQNLLEYCKLDTMAMMRIYEELEKNQHKSQRGNNA